MDIEGPERVRGRDQPVSYAGNDPVNLVDLTGENPIAFGLLGAAEGIGEDLFFQMVLEGKRWGCVDGAEVAIAGIVGALTGGTVEWLEGAARGGSVFGRNTVGAAERYAGRWGKGSFSSATDSLFHHFEKHGASVRATTAEQYLAKAEDFARRLSRARSFPVEGATEGVVRYVKAGKYIDIAADGSIISFGRL